MNVTKISTLCESKNRNNTRQQCQVEEENFRIMWFDFFSTYHLVKRPMALCIPKERFFCLLRTKLIHSLAYFHTKLVFLRLMVLNATERWDGRWNLIALIKEKCVSTWIDNAILWKKLIKLKTNEWSKMGSFKLA